MAHLFDPQSLFYHRTFPLDVLKLTLRHYLPSAQGYLIPRPLARSYYQICEDECCSYDFDFGDSSKPFPMSTSDYEMLPRNPNTSTLERTDLVNTANRVLKFLARVRKECNWMSYGAKRLARLFDDYLLFLFLLKERTPTDKPLAPAQIPIVPSLPIQAVWFSHMLQSASYSDFMMALNGTVGYDHPLNHPRSSAELEKLWEAIWKPYTKADYYKAKTTTSEFVKWKKVLSESFTPEMFVNDQDWLGEFEHFTQGTDVRGRPFLEKAHLGYQRMLWMKHGGEETYPLEELKFAPCPSIDLMWHSHLIIPQSYHSDMNHLLGYSPKHKLLALGDRTLKTMHDRESQEEKLWMNCFGESLFEYSSLQSVKLVFV